MASLKVVWIFLTIVALSAGYRDFNNANHDNGKYMLLQESAQQITIPERSSSRLYDINTLDLTNLNGQYYFFSIYQKMSFMDAMNFCVAYGLNLASVTTNQEHTLIDTYISSIGQQAQTFYLSGNKIGNRDVWYWLDGTLVSLPLWNPGEPNNGYNCMGIQNGLWYDVACDTAQFFVCEL